LGNPEFVAKRPNVAMLLGKGSADVDGAGAGETLLDGVAEGLASGAGESSDPGFPCPEGLELGVGAADSEALGLGNGTGWLVGCSEGAGVHPGS
jgi:hypothetical protein